MTPKTRLSPEKLQARSHLQEAIHFHHQQQFDAALASYNKAIELDPGLAQAYANRGALYMGHMNESALALADLNKAIELDPNFVDAYNNRGLLHVWADERELALADLNKATELDPDLADVYGNRGLLHMQANENELALVNLNRAIALKPDFFDAYNYRGIVLMAMRQFKPALESLEKALQLNPSSSEVYSNIGMAFMGNEQLDIALEYYEKAIQLNPDLALAYSNYANVLLKLNQCDAAIEWYDKAIALNPDHAHAYYSKTFPLLLLGRFEEGLPLYEFRFKVAVLKLRKMDIPGKLWLREESIQGKTILLCHDAGYGDTIQFCRYAKRVSGLGAKVILQVQPSLADLLKNLDGVDELIAHNEELTLETLDQYPPFDLYCPLMSLPLAFKTNLDTIPANTPYLYADLEKVAIWENRLGEKTKPRVGLVWSGNVEHLNDHNRSIMLSQLLPYLPDNCEYISLQKDIRDIDQIIFDAMTEWKHYEEELNDFSDTAALCSLMDVVVSVDTSVAHLSGALGKPVWVMLPFSPDWRWLLERKDNPWYPGMRLYRQNAPGDWNGVFDEVRRDLLGLKLHSGSQGLE